MHLSVNGRFLTQRVTGVQRYATEVLNALDCILDRRPDVGITVWSPKLPGPGPEWRNLVHKEAGHLSGNLWEQFELPFLSRGDPLFCPANTAPVLSLAGTQPVFVTIYDLSYAYFPEAYSRAFRLWYNLLIPLAMSRAEAILTVSETERASIIERFPSVAARIHVSPNGGWPRDILPDLDPRPVRDELSILYVGSLSKRKNFPAMLEIAIQLARKRGLRFRFVGGTAASLASSNQNSAVRRRTSRALRRSNRRSRETRRILPRGRVLSVPLYEFFWPASGRSDGVRLSRRRIGHSGPERAMRRCSRLLRSDRFRLHRRDVGSRHRFPPTGARKWSKRVSGAASGSPGKIAPTASSTSSALR